MRRNLTSEARTRCELALMGKVVGCSNEEVQSMTEYMLSAMNYECVDDEDFNLKVLDRINKYKDEDEEQNEVKYIVCNTIEGMKCITYLIDTHEEDEPKPFEEDYGSGFPCSFCYVLNVDYDSYSEFGDCFFEKRRDGFYHRVS